MASTRAASSASGSTAPSPSPPLPLCYSRLCNYDGIHQCRICPRQALHPHCMTVRSLHHMCSIEGHEGANIHNDCTDPTDIARQYIAGCTHGVCIITHSTAHTPTGLPRHATYTATSGGMATASRSSVITAEITTATHDAYDATCHTLTYRLLTTTDCMNITPVYSCQLPHRTWRPARSRLHHRS